MSLGRLSPDQLRQQSEARKAANLAALCTPVKTLHTASYEGALSGRAVEKECVSQHQGYMAAVRTLPCAHCGIGRPIQFAHADRGKGLGIKTDVRRGAPLCGPHDGKPGCHWLIGTSGTFTRQQRRDLEDEYARRTRAEILARGLWPRNLPKWKEDGQ